MLTRRLTVLAAIALITGALLSAMTGAARADRPAPAGLEQPAEPPRPAGAIRLVVDYRDGVQKAFVAIEHRADMTVFDALIEAGRHPRGVKVEHTGKGETAFVQKIDDLANQGGGRTARNWQFSVNDKPGVRGCGVTKLEPGDVVVWSFAMMKQGE